MRALNQFGGGNTSKTAIYDIVLLAHEDPAVTPTLRLLNDRLADRIIDEARDLLATLGIGIRDNDTLSLLADSGARVDRAGQRAWLTAGVLDRAVGSVPGAFRMFNLSGDQTHDFSGDRIHFTPASAALNILDHRSGEIRPPRTPDYIRFVKVTAGLGHLASQSTAFIPADVHERISDSYRLFLSLLYGDKPVVTGTFTEDGFEVIRDLLVAVRGGAAPLRHKPLAMLTCCPTSPLQWDETACRTLTACARQFIPVEIVSMPLAGFTAPVTLVELLVQHAAEILSGVVIGQLAGPGTPMLYGSSAAIFDMRFETTPMGAIETMMIGCGCNEIGKRLGMPTQAYIALSDAKRLDAQAGMETGMGAILAALSGINNISGPGMLDFISCHSLEKLVLDNEICGMALRLQRGVSAPEPSSSLPLFEELLRERHLIIADHTRRHLGKEIHVPGPVIDRASRPRWRQDGATTVEDRAASEVDRLEREARPTTLPDGIRRHLIERMEQEARRWGMETLPARAP
jgi:trimethylamine--corrinoid protein Co-methyltransferase